MARSSQRDIDRWNDQVISLTLNYILLYTIKSKQIYYKILIILNELEYLLDPSVIKNSSLLT